MFALVCTGVVACLCVPGGLHWFVRTGCLQLVWHTVVVAWFVCRVGVQLVCVGWCTGFGSLYCTGCCRVGCTGVYRVLARFCVQVGCTGCVHGGFHWFVLTWWLTGLLCR